MKLETLTRLLELQPTGRPCGRIIPVGPCDRRGLAPTGRCYLHGAAAARGPKGPKRKLTKAQTRAPQRRIAASRYASWS